MGEESSESHHLILLMGKKPAKCFKEKCFTVFLFFPPRSAFLARASEAPSVATLEEVSPLFDRSGLALAGERVKSVSESQDCGRDAGYPAPPARIRASAL